MQNYLIKNKSEMYFLESFQTINSISNISTTNCKRKECSEIPERKFEVEIKFV